MKIEDARKLLDIATDAELTKEVINRAYRRAALRHHPDKHATADKATQAEHAEEFKKLAEAKTVLLDDVRGEPVAAAGGGGGGGGGAAADDANPTGTSPAAAATERPGPTLPHKLTIIQGNDETTEYKDIQMFFKTQYGQSIIATISLGTNQDGISTRCVLESLLSAYLRTNGVDYRAIFNLAFPDGIAEAQAIIAPNTDALVLVGSDDDSFALLPELKQLTNEQFDQLLANINLRWVSMGKVIRPTSDNITLRDIANLTVGGHFILPNLASLLTGPTAGELAVAESKPDERAVPAEQSHMRLTMDLSSVSAYLNDDAWGATPPAGIQAMRKIFNPDTKDISTLFQQMQAIALTRQVVNQQPESQPGWLRNQSLSARVNRFYNCLIAANGMDDVIRFVRGGANPSQALLPGAAAGI